MPIPVDTCYQSLAINGVEYRAEDITVRWQSRHPTSITVTGIETLDGRVLETSPGVYAPVAIDFFGVNLSGMLSGFRRVRRGEAFTNVAQVHPNGLYALSRLYYFQKWWARQDDDPATLERTGLVVMFQKSDGSYMNIGEQIEDIRAAAATQWPSLPPFEATGAFLGTLIPQNEERNIKCLDALVKALKYFPAVVVRDSDGHSPVIITNTGKAWAGLPASFLMDDFGEDDGNIDSVTVEFVKNQAAAGSRWFGVDSETAAKPDPRPLAAFEGTLMYDGASGNVTRASLDVETEDIPDDLDDKNWWWKKAETFFKNSRLADIAISRGERSGKDDADRFPRIVTNTAMPDEINASGAQIKARVEVFSCKADYKVYNDKGELVRHEKDAPVSVDLITTNARTNLYKWTEGWDYDSGEVIPRGIAQHLLDAVLDARTGVVEFDLRDPAEPSIPLIGETHNGIPCQAVEVSSSTLVCRAEFAPSEKLSLDEAADLLRAFRGRSQSRYNRKSRETGEAPGGPEINAKKIAPVAPVQAGAGELKKEVLSGAEDPYKKIGLDPDDIAGEKKEAKMRGLSLLVYDASAKKAWTWQHSILATEGVRGEEVELGGDCDCGGGGECCHCCPECGKCSCCCGGGGGGGGGGGAGCDDRVYPGTSATPDEREYPGAGVREESTGSEDRRYPAKKYECY